MHVRGAFFLCACLVCGTAAAAQTTVLEYQGELLTGSSTSLPTGTVGPCIGCGFSLATEPFVGEISGSITFSGSPAAGNLTLTSYDFTLTGSGGANFPLNAGPSPIIPIGPPYCADNGSCIDLIILGQSVVGAALELISTPYHSDQSYMTVGPGGDSVSYVRSPPGATGGTCTNEVQGMQNPNDGTFTYTGPTIHNCTIAASNTDPGRWRVLPPTAAPELDWASAYAALTLLLGGLAVLRRHRNGARS